MDRASYPDTYHRVNQKIMVLAKKILMSSMLSSKMVAYMGVLPVIALVTRYIAGVTTTYSIAVVRKRRYASKRI